MNQELYVFIYLPGEITAVPAGIFTHDPDARIGTFRYGRRYPLKRGALPVDPFSLPLGREFYPEARLHGGLYGAFRDASPDSWGRTVMARQIGVRPETLSEFDFLAAANATRSGNLDFRESAVSSEPKDAPPVFASMELLLEAAEAVESGKKISKNVEPLVTLLVHGTSIGGARPKATVSRDGKLWIAKFPHKNDLYSNARVEFATMTLARKCGIEIPEMEVVEVDGRDVLLVRRFDRVSEQGGFSRLGYVSGLTVLDLEESDYASWSYLHLADALRQFTSPEDTVELYKRMVFNILVRNTDDHPRNHGLTHRDGGWRLSPAFDVAPAPSVPGINESFSLAMTVGKLGRIATIENAVSGSHSFGLTRDDAETKIFDMCSIADNWREVFSECGVNEETADRFAWSFENSGSPLNAGLKLDGIASPGY
jgi:serine/threonine-protein kinase HipA